MYASLPGETKSIFVPPVAENKNKKMNTTDVLETWNERKVKLREKFAYLTDNDLMLENGKTEEMLGELQIKLGKTKEELRKIIASL